VIRKKNHSRLL